MRQQAELKVHRQMTLTGDLEGSAEQLTIKREALEQQIKTKKNEQLQVEVVLNTVRDKATLPFVWDIAFTEIFSGDSHGFDIVIGNPPYLRQERIADPNLTQEEVTTENKKEYKAKLIRSVYKQYRPFFGYKPGADTASHKIDKKSDLYIYFYFHGLSLLNDNGSFCFITSNSWLDVGYGKDLQEFLLKRCHAKLVIDNKAKRSFKEAGVNTVIVLFGPPEDSKIADEVSLDKTARFVMFYVPFEEVLHPVVFEEIQEAKQKTTVPEYRIFPTRQSKLLIDGCETPDEDKEKGAEAQIQIPYAKIAKYKYLGNKWGGKYLRAPDIYWTILEKGKDKLVRLGDIARIWRGFTTGVNHFFYVDETKINKFQIEDKFLKPVIKSPKEVSSIYIPPETLKTKVFICDLPKRLLQDTGALAYISWGEEQVTKGRKKQQAGIPWPQLPTLQNRRHWYSLNLKEPGDFYCNRFFGDRFFFSYSKNVVEDQTFYAGRFHQRNLQLTFCMAVLNCTIGYLTASLLGRVALGEGVLQYAVYEMEDLTVINPWAIDPKERDSIVSAFYKLKDRKIQNINVEMTQKDRKALDQIIFENLGLTKQECDAVYEAVVDLVESRLNKAESLSS